MAELVTELITETGAAPLASRTRWSLSWPVSCAAGAAITVTTGYVALRYGLVCPCHPVRALMLIPLAPAWPGYAMYGTIPAAVLSGTVIYGMALRWLWLRCISSRQNAVQPPPTMVTISTRSPSSSTQVGWSSRRTKR